MKRVWSHAEDGTHKKLSERFSGEPRRFVLAISFDYAMLWSL
ncbi:MAG: hypothetical protein V1792_01615 [Pseudomonadota bacterium]